MASSNAKFEKCPQCTKEMVCKVIIIKPEDMIVVDNQCEDCKHVESHSYKITKEFEPFIQKLRELK